MPKPHLALALAVALVAAVVPTAAGASETRWVPEQGLRWQYQLQGKVKTTFCKPPRLAPKGSPCVRPDVYDIDLYDKWGVELNTDAVDAIHALGAKAVCYVSAGTWENWRPDASFYPAELRGSGNGWPGERWLDIRATDVLLPLIETRVGWCVDAGFDAVEFDNVDAYTNNSGFPLTAADQLAFNRALAGIAHDDGLSVGLKNDLDQLADLVGDFDFAINEQCYEYEECAVYDDWLAAGKAVVEVEYRGPAKKQCLAAVAAGRDMIRKRLALKAGPWKPCI